MTQYGKIHSYDTNKGAGMIKPDKGGDALPFQKADLQQQAEVPMADQRYGYDTRQGDGGKSRAINLQMEQGDNDSGSGQQGESDERSDQQSQSENRSAQPGDSDSGQNHQGQNQKSQNNRDSGPQG